MDAIQRLRQLGQPEPVDQAVLDSALRRLAEAISQHPPRSPLPGRATPRRSRLITATAVAAALAAAAAVAIVAIAGHAVPGRGGSGTSGGSGPVSQRRSGTISAPSGAPSRHASSGSATVAAVLTAFKASRSDTLLVTRIVRGEGSCCRSRIWIWPAGPAPGTMVRSRVQDFTLTGTRLTDMALTYTVPAAVPAAGAPATGVAGCQGIFGRPRLELSPAAGVPGTLTLVSYPGHLWVRGHVRIQAATVPRADSLRTCLADGQWHEAGKRAETIRLVSPDGAERLWVNAATFLPERLVSTNVTPYGPVSVTLEFRFLLPTAAILAMLAPPSIPRGFSRQPVSG